MTGRHYDVLLRCMASRIIAKVPCLLMGALTIAWAGLLTSISAHAIAACAITASKGEWNYFRARDLPRGQCVGEPCAVWTRDSCPGTDMPGPAIRWECVCDAGAWNCREVERSKSVCLDH